MTWAIVYSRHIDRRSFVKINAKDRTRIRKAIEEKLRVRPEIFGKPLRQSFLGCRSLRVGDYRVIYTMEGKTVRIMLIGHRSVIYDEHKRLP